MVVVAVVVTALKKRARLLPAGRRLLIVELCQRASKDSVPFHDFCSNLRANLQTFDIVLRRTGSSAQTRQSVWMIVKTRLHAGAVESRGFLVVVVGGYTISPTRRLDAGRARMRASDGTGRRCRGCLNNKGQNHAAHDTYVTYQQDDPMLVMLE